MVAVRWLSLFCMPAVLDVQDLIIDMHEDLWPS